MIWDMSLMHKFTTFPGRNYTPLNQGFLLRQEIDLIIPVITCQNKLSEKKCYIQTRILFIKLKSRQSKRIAGRLNRTSGWPKRP